MTTIEQSHLLDVLAAVRTFAKGDAGVLLPLSFPTTLADATERLLSLVGAIEKEIAWSLATEDPHDWRKGLQVALSRIEQAGFANVAAPDTTAAVPAVQATEAARTGELQQQLAERDAQIAEARQHLDDARPALKWVVNHADRAHEYDRPYGAIALRNLLAAEAVLRGDPPTALAGNVASSPNEERETRVVWGYASRPDADFWQGASSREDAIASARELGGEAWIRSGTYADPAAHVPSADDFIDDMNQDAADNGCPDEVEDAFQFTTIAGEELERLLIAWARTHVKTNWWVPSGEPESIAIEGERQKHRLQPQGLRGNIIGTCEVCKQSGVSKDDVCQGVGTP